MVRHMPNQQMRLDRVFRALGDPTRRAVLGRLGVGPAPVSELARPFDMALPSFTQHLDVLERCGLVRSQKVGRVRTYRLVPQPLEAAERWMAQQRALWEPPRSTRQLPAGAEGEDEMTTALLYDPRLDLLLERVVDVPPELVWAAWTVPEHV